VGEELDDARGGGPEGVAVLWRTLNPQLERYLGTLVGHAAQDVASETWLQAARDLPGFRGDGVGFRVWLFRIGRNRAIDELRRAGRRREDLTAEPGGYADLAPDAATVAEERLGTVRAMALLARLPREQAEAVMLRVVFGLDAKACGQILAAPSPRPRDDAPRRVHDESIADERAGYRHDDGVAAACAFRARRIRRGAGVRRRQRPASAYGALDGGRRPACRGRLCADGDLEPAGWTGRAGQPDAVLRTPSGCLEHAAGTVRRAVGGAPRSAERHFDARRGRERGRRVAGLGLHGGHGIGRRHGFGELVGDRPPADERAGQADRVADHRARPLMGARRGRRRAARAVPPRAHWLVLLATVVLLAGVLALDGLVHDEVGGEGSGGPHSPGSAAHVPASILHGGPVIDTRHGAANSYQPVAGRIALSFDDGPDPQWTPQILSVLARYHVPGTFFLVGGRVAQYPGLVRQEVAAGDEVGIHTFTHDDLATAGETRRNFEFSQTQSVIEGAAGVSTSLLRPPYSSEAAALDDLDWAAVQDAGAHGYVTVLTDRDSLDWQRPGVAKIVANVVPASGTPGMLVMMHDAGGDRAQTVAALEILIPKLLARGYRFTTVSGLIGQPSPITPATASQRLRGQVLVYAVEGSGYVVTALSWAILATGALSVIRVLILLVAAGIHHRRRRRRAPVRAAAARLPVSVIVPAYNEEKGIASTVESLLRTPVPLEIIVVDDGSSDRTAQIARGYERYGVRVITQPNGGKPAALNTGISQAHSPILVLLDGDTVFEPDAIPRLAAYFADPAVGAVSGNAKVGNRKGLLGRWQHIEYVVGFNLDRRFYDLAGCMPTVPGAIGAFRREALAQVGGVSDDTLAEDTDLTMAVLRAGWRAVYAPDAIAWTEAPASLGQLWKQRYRWSYGTMQAMWKHRRAVIESGASGRLGRRGLPYLLLFQVLLPLLAPLVDVFAVWGLIFGQALETGAVWFGFVAVQILASWYAFRLDGERARVLWSVPFQQFVYRQLMYLVVIQSVVTALIGSRLRWQRMDRRGMGAPPGMRGPSVPSQRSTGQATAAGQP
jgi:cellulose synthase/poly-beta-1,6-N-acetylglucosamine synthase-like glycosyltransferase/peptidoglycan/xylan/chitin deacetylase (PgdA/CDA1 family)/DNA-directed RNA polymerase specialized sigma24 family protein